MPKKLEIADAIELASSRGGRCLSTTYKNNFEDLDWICKNDHEFRKPLKKAKKGEWCPYCSGKYVVFKPEELLEIARTYGGTCDADGSKKISEYINWTCCDGHTWSAMIYNVVKNKSWCPHCKSFVGEESCRYIFEKLTGEKFPKSRPPWLKLNGKKSLELDGYNKDLSIAFEHQGRQHYENTLSRFSCSEILTRDALKRETCKQHNVSLLEIPEIGALSSLEDALTLIKNFLNAQQIPLVAELSTSDISSNSATLHKNQINQLDQIAKSKGGRCLASQYLGHVIPIEFECSQGHRWLARPNDIKRGSWCSVCSRAGGKRKTIEDLKQLAHSYNLECTSSSYSNSKASYAWRCHHGHHFECRYEYIKAIKGCPTCIKNKFA